MIRDWDTKSSRSQGPSGQDDLLLPEVKVLGHLLLVFGRIQGAAARLGFYFLTAVMGRGQPFALPGLVLVDLFEFGVADH